MNAKRQNHLQQRVYQARKIQGIMAERVGFEPLIAERCTALHGPVNTLGTKYLAEFRLTTDLIYVFRRLIVKNNVAQRTKM
jgi:hypothetical protein